VLKQPPTPGVDGPFAWDEGVETLFCEGVASVHTARADIPVVFADVSAGRPSPGQRVNEPCLSVPQEHRADVLAEATSRFEQIADSDAAVRLTVGVRYTLARRPAQAVDAAS